MYQAICKCRLCGEKFSNGEMKNEMLGVFSGRLDVKDYAIKIHNCQDGSFGLADFQGFKKAED